MDSVILMLKGFVPGHTETTWGACAGVCGVVLSYLFGEWNNLLEILIALMVLDYFSGTLAAYINPKLALNSQKGFRGILKKIMILLLVSLAHFTDRALGVNMAFTAVVCFFICNEGLSIVENAAKAGVPIPKKLRDTLEQLTEEKQAKEK